MTLTLRISAQDLGEAFPPFLRGAGAQFLLRLRSTLEEATRAAEAGINFIKEVGKDHYKEMCAACK